MLQPQLQSAAHEIEHERPIRIAVAISSHDCDWRAERAQLVENAFGANIAKMPDFIGASGDFSHVFGQTIMRVRDDENASHLVSCFFSVRRVSLHFGLHSAGKTEARAEEAGY